MNLLHQLFYIQCLCIVHYETKMVSLPEGELASPSSAECGKSLPFKKVWEFTVPRGAVLLIQFTHFLIPSCSTETLMLETKERSYYCGEFEPLTNYLLGVNIIELTSSTGECSGLFRLKYAMAEFSTGLISTGPFRVGELVAFRYEWRHLSDFRVKCRFECTSSNQHTLTHYNETVYCAFSEPGVAFYDSQCSASGIKLDLRRNGHVYIENILSIHTLQLLNSQRSKEGSIAIVISHLYLFPVLYEIFIGNYTLQHTSGVYDSSRYKTKARISIEFPIHRIAMITLGTGRHNYSILLQNNVSTVLIDNLHLYITTRLINLTTVVLDCQDRHIGNELQSANIQLSIGQGAPANITLQVQDLSGLPTVSQTFLYCSTSNECTKLVARVNIPELNKQYRINASAVNDISSVATMSQVFEVYPQILDVYMFSNRSVFGLDTVIVLYFKGDVGDYRLRLFVENRLATQSLLEILPRTYPPEPDSGKGFPVDVSSYKPMRLKVKFKSPGKKIIVASVSNSKQVFNYTFGLLVQQNPSCLNKVKIRTYGNSNYITSVPVNGLLLSVDTKYNCTEKMKLKFEWKFYESDANFDFAKTENEIALDRNNVENEIILERYQLPPGHYIVMVIVSTKDAVHNNVTAEQRDYIRIKLPTRNLDVVIIGGSSREIGNSSVVNLTAKVLTKINPNSTLSYNWFCAKSQNDFPSNSKLGKLLRKGSCFGWEPLLIGKLKSLKVTRFEPNSRYFIRVIVLVNGIDSGYADQELNTLSSNNPQLTAKCISNCKYDIISHRPVIVESECTDCHYLSWSFDNSTLERCENKTICKLDTQTFSKKTGQRNHTLVVKGFNVNGSSSSATFNFATIATPGEGKCSISPTSGIAGITQFSVSCHDFKDIDGPIMYKFSVSTKRTGVYLAQYGYENTIKELTLPQGDEQDKYVAIITDVCNGIGSCYQQVLNARVSKNEQASAEIMKHLDFALNARNLQRIVQLVVPMTSTNVMTSLQRNQILRLVSDITLVSRESVQQMGDLISHVTNKPAELTEDSVKLVWKKITEIKAFITKDHSDDTNFTAILTSCVKSVANILQSPNLAQTMREGTIRMSEFVQQLLSEIVPGDQPMVVQTSASQTTLTRMDHSSADRLVDKTTDFHLQSMPEFNVNDFINLQVSKFKTNLINFNTYDRKVNHVTSVFISTGWQKPVPLPTEKLKDMQPVIRVTPKPKSLSIRFQPNGDCNSTICTVYASMTIDRVSTTENEEGAYLIIDVKIEKVKVADLHLELRGELSIISYNNSKSILGEHLIWKIHIARLPESISSYNLYISANVTEWNVVTTGVDSTISTYFINCLFWEDGINNWNTKGCKPSTNVNFEVVCKCNSFPSKSLGRSFDDSDNVPTLFASRLIVYPNKIDYDKLSWNLWEEFLKNPIIFCILFWLYSTYLLLLMWAKRIDIETETQKCFIEVCDNIPTHNYRYYVTFYLGSSMFTPKNSTILLMLVGSENMGKTHILQNSGQDILAPSSVRSFLITTESSLGNVIGVRLLCRTESSRLFKTTWHLQRIVVRDLEINECCFLLCNCWIDENSDQYFKVASYKDLHTFYRLFRFKSENYLRDRHLWVSMFTMRSWQKEDMTRVQRLSSCYHLIFIIMLTTLMFYGGTASLSAFKVGIGGYIFQWSQVAIGLESCLLCFPMTFVVTTLFRLCQRRSSVQEKHVEGASGFHTVKQLKPKDSTAERKQERRVSKDTYKARLQSRQQRRSLKRNVGIDLFSSASKLTSRRDSDQHRMKKNPHYGNSRRVSREPEKYHPNIQARSPRYSSSTSRKHSRDYEYRRPSTSLGPSYGIRRTLHAKVKKVKFEQFNRISLEDSHLLQRKSPEVTSSRSYAPNPSEGMYGLSTDAIATNRIRHPLVDIDPYSADFRPLPPSFVIVPWTIIFASVVGSSVICVMYGMTYGLDTCIQWLFSLSVGFLNSFMILEPLKALLLAYFKVVNNPRHDLSDWLTPITDKVYPRRRRRRKSSRSKKRKNIQVDGTAKHDSTKHKR